MDTTLRTFGTTMRGLGPASFGPHGFANRAVTVAISDLTLTFDRRGRDCGSRRFRL
jgi:hypothetical protein